MLIQDTIRLMCTSKPVSTHQTWSGYPNSPVLTSQYPYQCIVHMTSPAIDALYVSNNPWRGQYGAISPATTNNLVGNFYYYSSGAWGSAHAVTGSTMNAIDKVYEANRDIYTDSSCTTVYFAKTTS